MFSQKSFRKQSFISSALAVLASVVAVAGFVYAATTIGTNISVDGNLTVSGTSATSTFSAGGFTVGTNQFVVQQTSGNVGIGTTSPYAKLSVVGSSDIPQLVLKTARGQASTTPSFQIVNSYGNPEFEIRISDYALGVAGASGNTFIGVGAGTSTRFNSSTGAGYGNTSVGYQTFQANTTGTENNAFGYQALYANTVGGGNVAMGLFALNANTTGNDNIAIGNSSLFSNTTGVENVAIGTSAIANNLTGNDNIAIGITALLYNQSAASSTAVGSMAGRGLAAYHNQGGVYIGYRSGYSVQTNSDYNTLVGFQAGYDITTGTNNTILGQFTTTGTGITQGSNNILIGQGVRAGLSQTGSNQLNIGNLIFATGLGSGATIATGNVGIGTTTPFSRFHVSQGASATTTVNFGEVGSATSKACFNTKNTAGTDISFYFNTANALVVESNLCR